MGRSFWDLSIQQKITWIVVVVTSVTLLVTCAGMIAYDLVTFRQAMVQRLATVADVVGFNSASAIAFNDQASAHKTLAALHAVSSIDLAAIYTADGQVFATYARSQSRPESLPHVQPEQQVFQAGHLALFHRILLDQEVIGTIFIRSDLTALQLRLQRYLLMIGGVFLGAMLIAVALSARLQRTITEPIVSLARTVSQVSVDKDYAVRVVQRSQDEIGLLVRGFNEMLAQIQQRDTELQRSRDALEERVEERTRDLQQQIAERVKAEGALREYTKQVERSNKELDDFTYIVSHDLKEPLRSIDAFTKFVAEDHGPQLPAEGREYLERVRANAQRMQQLIDDLLTVSRLSRRPNELQTVQVAELLHEVRLRFEYVMQQKSVQLAVVGELPTLLCDRVRLTEVFANLISNAVKYNDKPVCRIEVSCQLRDGWHQFSIQDNGPGIEPQYHDKIFEVFQRLGKREDQEGTGVGLAIVKKVVELHSGRVWVESVPGHGATFHFTIPQDEHILLGKQKLGEILVAKGLVQSHDVEQALQEQERSQDSARRDDPPRQT